MYFFAAALAALLTIVNCRLLEAADATQPSSTSTRYFDGLLDTRSSYGNDFFPDPFIGPEFDAEQQFELDYLHSQKRGIQDDEVDAGAQWNVAGELTIAGEFGWDSLRESASSTGGDDEKSGSGFENVDLAVYHPIFQYVSDNRQFDYTAVARLDFGIPTGTRVSGTDLQLTPYLGQLLRLGDHVSVETWTGSQFTIAPHPTNQFIYGGLIGYEIFPSQLRLPLTSKLTPIFELDGQTPYSHNGQDALFSVIGFDIQLGPFGDFQPDIEIGYQAPLDQGARQQSEWGIIAEVLLDF
jgi:hypothetical protein